METSELKIGSFIEYSGEMRKVCLLSDTFVKFKIEPKVIRGYTYQSSPPLHISNFNPVPLTEKILLNFGFKHRENPDGYDEYFIDKFTIEVLYLSDTTSFIYYTYDGDVEIEYSHQLQNLYQAIHFKELEYNGK